MKAKDLDELFDKGEEDILQHFDLTSVRRVNRVPEIVQLDIPKQDLAQLDAEVSRLGTTRDRLISEWVRERLEKVSAAE